jgi:uncharacterized membrane protein YkvA (DUF1232 family)
VSKAIETFKSWAESINQDVEAVKKLVECEDAHLDARKLGAAALNYLVTRMDLIPDWNEGIGALDDVMILRVCVLLAQGHRLGEIPADAEMTLARLGNEAEQLKTLLGFAIADKLKAYCSKLVDNAVRGRTPAQIVSEPDVRKALYGDVDEELKRSLPVVVKDPADAELKLKAYLGHKLK